MKIVKIKINELRIGDELARKTKSSSYKYLRESITQHGFLLPIVVTMLNEVVDGRVRIRIARELKMQEIPCLVIDVKDAQEARLALNNQKLVGYFLPASIEDYLSQKKAADKKQYRQQGYHELTINSTEELVEEIEGTWDDEVERKYRKN